MSDPSLRAPRRRVARARARVLALAAVAASAFGLAACASTGAASPDASRSASVGRPLPPLAGAHARRLRAAATGDVEFSAHAVEGERLERALSVASAGTSDGDSGGESASSADAARPHGPSAPTAPIDAPPVADDRYIVRTADLRVERDDPEAGPPQVALLARTHGGWVQASERTRVTVRVPAARLETVLAAVGTLGDVTRRDVRGEDVTEEFLDLNVRAQNLHRSRTRYLALLERAQNVAETIQVEQQLERVTAEIERLEGRIQFLSKSVGYSTLTVSFERAVTPGPVGWVFYGLWRGAKWLFVWD